MFINKVLRESELIGEAEDFDDSNDVCSSDGGDGVEAFGLRWVGVSLLAAGGGDTRKFWPGDKEDRDTGTGTPPLLVGIVKNVIPCGELRAVMPVWWAVEVERRGGRVKSGGERGEGMRICLEYA